MHWNRPTVERFMTEAPIVVSPSDPLSLAAHAMVMHRVRHLVVCEGSKIAGVVSQRDVFYTEAHRDDAAEVVRVADAMTPFVYTVEPGSLVEDVARDLADAKYGAAVVVRGETPIGIFTTTDALRMLTIILADLRVRASRDSQSAEPLAQQDATPIVGGER